MRRCSTCKKTDSETAFNPKQPKTGERCKLCDRWAKYKRRGGTQTYAEFRLLLEALATASCEICDSREHLCIDHCHKSGKLRGILCRSCNRALGLLGDDPERLEAAAAYLKNGVAGIPAN